MHVRVPGCHARHPEHASAEQSLSSSVETALRWHVSIPFTARSEQPRQLTSSRNAQSRWGFRKTFHHMMKIFFSCRSHLPRKACGGRSFPSQCLATMQNHEPLSNPLPLCSMTDSICPGSQFAAPRRLRKTLLRKTVSDRCANFSDFQYSPAHSSSPRPRCEV